MATEKLIRRAKVTLIRGKTYTLAGEKFIRNVPKIVRGSACQEFANNGRFSCTELEPKEAAKKKKKSSSEGDQKKSKSDKKLKSSSKKKAGKKSSKK